jgi:hypothetical protein
MQREECLVTADMNNGHVHGGSVGMGNLVSRTSNVHNHIQQMHKLDAPNRTRDHVMTKHTRFCN